MPPRRVKAYVKWGAKNDQADAAACNEAVTRPSMQFFPIKSIEQQAVLMLHRARSLLDKQCTQLSNAIRGHSPLLILTVPLLPIEKLLKSMMPRCSTA